MSRRPHRALAMIEQPAAGEPVLELHGELDVADAPALREWLAAVARDADGEVVVDLRRVAFMELSIVRVLVDEALQLKREGKELVIACEDPALIRMLAFAAVPKIARVVAARG